MINNKKNFIIGIDKERMFNTTTVFSVAIFKMLASLKGVDIKVLNFQKNSYKKKIVEIEGLKKEMKIYSDDNNRCYVFNPENAYRPEEGILIDLGEGCFDCSEVFYDEGTLENDFEGEWCNAITNKWNHPIGTPSLIWTGYYGLYYGKEICKIWVKVHKMNPSVFDFEEFSEQVNRRLFVGISAKEFDDFWSSNVDFLEIDEMIADFEPALWEENKSKEKAFEEAVDFAVNIIDRIINQVAAKLSAKQIVIKTAENAKNGIAFFETAVPWKAYSWIFEEIYYVISPSIRGNFNCEAVPEEYDRNSQKKPFPTAWCGKRNSELADVSGVEDAVFCHSGGFLCVAESLEGAKKLAELSLDDWKARHSDEEDDDEYYI